MRFAPIFLFAFGLGAAFVGTGCESPDALAGNKAGCGVGPTRTYVITKLGFTREGPKGVTPGFNLDGKTSDPTVLDAVNNKSEILGNFPIPGCGVLSFFLEQSRENFGTGNQDRFVETECHRQPATASAVVCVGCHLRLVRADQSAGRGLVALLGKIDRKVAD